MQELIAAADASGIVRTYRPLPLPPSQGLGYARGRPFTALAAGEAKEGASRPGSHAIATQSDASARPFQLVVECRLGARPVLCDFAVGTRRDRARENGEVGGQHGENGDEGEVLRSCTVGGDIRVWPTASLPTHPLRPTPAATPMPTSLTGDDDDDDDQEALAPQPQPLNASGGGGDGGGIKGGNRPPTASVGGQENKDPSDHPFARWATSAIDGQGRGAAGGPGVAPVGRGEKVGERGEELTARGKPPVPVPKARAAGQRRVSFAPADEVCNGTVAVAVVVLQHLSPSQNTLFSLCFWPSRDFVLYTFIHLSTPDCPRICYPTSVVSALVTTNHLPH